MHLRQKREKSIVSDARADARHPLRASLIRTLILLQVTETRSGPLGCSSYDNLDSVSSILLQSPESKLHLQGKQVHPPDCLN